MLSSVVQPAETGTHQMQSVIVVGCDLGCVTHCASQLSCPCRAGSLILEEQSKAEGSLLMLPSNKGWQSSGYVRVLIGIQQK